MKHVWAVFPTSLFRRRRSPGAEAAFFPSLSVSGTNSRFVPTKCLNSAYYGEKSSDSVQPYVLVWLKYLKTCAPLQLNGTLKGRISRVYWGPWKGLWTDPADTSASPVSPSRLSEQKTPSSYIEEEGLIECVGCENEKAPICPQ